MAEVRLTLDNAARTAPGAFNDSDVIEVSRRIERDAGSNFRVNGREVRARDISFSSPMLRPARARRPSCDRGRSAKSSTSTAAAPRILEEAAGIAGLYSRRHEAELRLKAAENNLVRP